MKSKMGPPPKRSVLRLTPIPRESVSPPALPSLIIKLRIPPQPATNTTPVNPPRLLSSLHDFAIQHTKKHAIKSENSSTNTSPEDHKANIFSSSPSVSSASTTTPTPEVVPECILLDNRRKEDAAEAVKLFKKWGYEDLNQQLREAIQAQNNAPGSVELALVTKKAWVRESLRSRYNVYIQSYSEHVVEEHRMLRGSTGLKSEVGTECEYPGCGRHFSAGEYRVAFEPREWSAPPVVKKATALKLADLSIADPDSGSDSESEESIKPEAPVPVVEPVIPLPDYHKLLTSRFPAEGGRGEFYCVKCFEKLLELDDSGAPATGRVGKRKRAAEKWTRPSPLCRIYSSVFAEMRVSPEGRYVLDYNAHETVRRWKDAVFDEKMEMLMANFGGRVLKTGELVKKGDEENAGPFKFQVDGGRGLAECLTLLKGDTKVPRGRKKTKY